MRKTIDDVRHELHQLQARSREQHAKDVKRAETAEKELVVQKARAEAFSAALQAVLEDMKKLGLQVGPKET
jgi:hypothetical protein